MGEEKRDHRYSSDFVIVKKTGEFYIIEVKAENKRGDKTTEAKRKAMEQLQKMQPDKFRYNVVYASEFAMIQKEFKPMMNWIRTWKC